jgi:hypothetical protein
MRSVAARPGARRQDDLAASRELARAGARGGVCVRRTAMG